MNLETVFKLKSTKRLKVLVACEYSGRVRDAFVRAGHDAMSCDILPTDEPGCHYQGNVLDILNKDWDMLIAHPPCTYLCNSGVHHLHRDGSRWDKMKKGAEFFKQLWQSDIGMIAIENPIMHKYAKELIGCGKQTQIVQPWMFGHTEQKSTCLWLKNLQPLKETHNVKSEMMSLPDKERQRNYFLPASEDRWKLRSITYSGIASAMAEQWGR